MFNSSCYRGFPSERILSFSEAEVRYLWEYWISIQVLRTGVEAETMRSPGASPQSTVSRRSSSWWSWVGPWDGSGPGRESILVGRSDCSGLSDLGVLLQEGEFWRTRGWFGLTGLRVTSLFGGRTRGRTGRTGRTVWQSSQTLSSSTPGTTLKLCCSVTQKISGNFFHLSFQFKILFIIYLFIKNTKTQQY